MNKQLADTLIEFIKREITWGSIIDPSTLTNRSLSDDNDEWINKFISDPEHRKRIIKQGISTYRDSTGDFNDPTMKQQLTQCLQSNIQYITTELIRYCQSILNRYQQLRDELKQSNESSRRESNIQQARSVIHNKVRSIKQSPSQYKSSFYRLTEISRLSKPDKDRLWNEYVTAWNEYQSIKNQQRQQHEQLFPHSRDRNIAAARELINEKVQSITTKPSEYKNRFMNLQEIKILNESDKNMLWNEYVTAWDEINLNDLRLSDTFMDKLKAFVINHQDKLLTMDEFINVVSQWPQTSKTREEWYRTYQDLYFKLPSTFTSIRDQITPKVIAFKSPNKIRFIQSSHPNLQPMDPSTNPTSYFPLKENSKRYQLHKVSPSGTYIIDLVFTGKLCYLFAINVNTRYLFVELMNEILFTDDEDTDESKTLRISKKNTKTTTSFIRTLQKLIDRGMNVKHLQGDGEKSFGANKSLEFYKSNHITFTSVPRMKLNVSPSFMKPVINDKQWNKSAPMHSSLGILDRVVRTIRDMAYNMKVGIITPGIMKVLVDQYNNAPHKTLSKYLEMDITPQMVQDDPELEDYITRQIHKQNNNIMNQPGFKLAIGTPVKIYNERDSMMKRRSIIQPGKYHIVDFHNGMYIVADDKNNTQLIPRYKLDVTI